MRSDKQGDVHKGHPENWTPSLFSFGNDLLLQPLELCLLFDQSVLRSFVDDTSKSASKRQKSPAVCMGEMDRSVVQVAATATLADWLLVHQVHLIYSDTL